MLEPTPERLAAARAASDRDWTFGAEGTVEIDRNPTLAEMVAAGLILPRFVSPTAQINGAEDHYRLTPSGEKWLAQHTQEATDVRP